MEEKLEERKIVPIAAMISAGKSKILNVILNFNLLESKAGIATKFVNILRYNPSINTPKFYHLKLKNEEGKYIFYKDQNYSIITGEQNIIEENKNLNKKLSNQNYVNYDDIFYITEINSPGFIKDTEYLLSHDLCDIPGLSEYQDDTNKTNEDKRDDAIKIEEDDNKNEKKNNNEELVKKLGEFGLSNSFLSNNDNDNDFIFKKELENNDEDDIFNEVNISNESSYLVEIYKRIKEYIDGAIIVLSIENYYFKENIEIITKLHKITQIDIQNFLIIFNKLDLSTNPNYDIQKCKGKLIQAFPKFKTFNLNLNIFVPISAIQLQNELLMNKSFKYYINYHFYNFYKNIKIEKNGKTFIDYLKDILKEKSGMKKHEIENKVDHLNNSDDINSQIKSIIKELNNTFKADDNIILGITENDIDGNNDENDLLKLDDEIRDNDNINDLDPLYVIKIFYYFQLENQFMNRSLETETLLNYFKKSKYLKKEKYCNIVEKTISNNKINNQIIDELTLFLKEFQKDETNFKQIENLTNEILQIIHYLRIYDILLIPFLGASNAGKSTIINGIIGRDLLPCGLEECTKRGIVIRYLDDEEDEPTIKKAYLKEEKLLNKNYYYFESKYIIGIGEESIKQTLRGLNYEYNKKEEDSFYYIKTKIKLFDDMGLNNNLKKRIYLIDLPGFGTENIFEKRIYKKVLSICNSFIFVVRDFIKTNASKIQLNLIFNQAKDEKLVFLSKFIKTCLFIVNHDENQNSSDENINKAKIDIQTLIKGVDYDDIKLCFFNAKYYSNYCSNYNYFYEWENTFKTEYNNYKYPNYYLSNYCPGFLNSFLSKNIKDFPKHLYSLLIKKAKIFNINYKKNLQKIDNQIEISINNSFKGINEDNNRYKNEIIKLISFCRENIGKLKTLKESNIEQFKNVLNEQIDYSIKSKQNEFIEIIEKVLSILDIFFGTKEKKTNSQEINDFNNNINEIKDEILILLNNNTKKVCQIKEAYKLKWFFLLEKKKNLEEALKKMNYKEILNEIKQIIKDIIKEFIIEIKENLDYNDNKCHELFNKAEIIISNFSNNKDIILQKLGFKSYLSKELLSDQNLITEMMTEINNSCEGLFAILNKKGFIQWIYSCFSNNGYLKNVIDLILEAYSINIYKTLDKIDKKTEEYLNDVLNIIDRNIESSTLEFNKKQKEKWDKLCEIYNNTKIKIKEIESKL